MNLSIRNLAGIASKPAKHIIGLMSGTSLDGLDIALCEVRGSGEDTSVELIQFETSPYSHEIKKKLKKISSVTRVSLEQVCLMHTWLGDYHGKLILETLDKWGLEPDEIDCIASHGQTIYHAPFIQHQKKGIPNTTLQIGDGDHIARKTGILTISDFRQKHTAAGGEGAPMVSLVDRILFSHEKENRVLLNIGGIANFTWLPALRKNHQPSITTDTGPGNTIIDAAAQEYFDRDFDKDSKIAKKGTVNHEALGLFKSHPYFGKQMPKTTGPEVFNLDWVNKTLRENLVSISKPEDLVATLTRFSAETIAEAILKMQEIDETAVIYVSGGGIHNPLMMEWSQEIMGGFNIKNFKEIGFDPDAKEAVLFAVLANETLSGSGFAIDECSNGNEPVNFGKISFPC